MDSNGKYIIGLVFISGKIIDSTAINVGFKLRSLPASTKHLIVIVSSDGGSLASAQSLINFISFLKFERKIKVSTYIPSQALSAGFYLALSSDYIACEKSTMIGNVGAVYNSLNFNKALKKLGIDYLSIASGSSKESLRLLQGSSSVKTSSIENYVSEVGEHFLDFVCKKRNLDVENVKKFLGEGEVITGCKGKVIGLVDSCNGLLELISSIVLDNGPEFEILQVNKLDYDCNDRVNFNEIIGRF
ncbi:S49 family peptidase [Idiomarina sp. M1R2S28]|uniref:S49 family peptidase n=1 Tax=Idiomarina rhizosphaerae TaxID=2961572 RepID=A0A9X2JVU0_9GAMM|nr:S49 family peptidase [Idiomarina rhizosphaerae]MCP1340381.1 S49 family peptidase [Idiomarina rhizosphaerae]